MQIETITNAYRRVSPVYDAAFGPVLHAGRRQIIHALDCRPGERVLEVGVGTGLSLSLYPSDVRVTGIDISPEMLAKARQRVERKGLSQVEEILEMDAQEMKFSDQSFDKVVAMYVVSVVPDYQRLVEEMRRVCKPQGEICIVNHFLSTEPLARRLVGLSAPLARLAGYRLELELDRFLQETGLQVEEARSVNLFGLWKLLRCRNNGAIPGLREGNGGR